MTTQAVDHQKTKVLLAKNLPETQFIRIVAVLEGAWFTVVCDEESPASHHLAPEAAKARHGYCRIVQE